MDIESFRHYCISKKGVTEDLPFDENTLAFRVLGKIFALTDIDAFESVNLKCDPSRAIELRNQFHGVLPGYHMNKQHWNTVLIDSDVSDQLLFELVDHSYDLIINGLPKKLKTELQNLKS